MNVLEIKDVVKQYGDHTAVNNVAFDVPKGSIFGLLGPNGAGKTSLIRIITRITGADSGQILLNGVPIQETSVRDIGYMPEERGLYKKMKVGEHLMYLAQLRELDTREAKIVIDEWLTKFGITDWWNKKIEELSKGMQQKIQFIATVMHKPSLIILDEPFSGLDPLNTNLIKEEIFKMNENGTSIIFSTHRMEQVEEICKDIVLINNGKKILEGKVDSLKQDLKENRFSLQYKGDTIKPSQTFDLVSDNGMEAVLKIQDGKSNNDVLLELVNQSIEIVKFEELLPSLNEIFIRLVENKSHE